MRKVARTTIFRVTTVTLRSGLHGWHTSHRYGGNEKFYLCNREGNPDSMDHISRCSITRKVWEWLMPGKAFCNYALMGFNAFQWSEEELANCAMIPYGIHEFHRHWKNKSRRHVYDTQSGAKAVIHFMATGLSGARGV